MAKRGKTKTKTKKKTTTLESIAKHRAEIRRRCPSEAIVDAVVHGHEQLAAYPFECQRCGTSFPHYYEMAGICYECYLHQLPPQYLNDNN